MITTATNAQYDQREHSWRLTRTFATGTGASSQLMQGYYEAQARFAKRRRLAQFFPLTASLIRRLAGHLYSQEVEREAPIDVSNIGARGESIQVIAAEIAQTILLYNSVVIVIDQGVRVLPPIDCPRWDDGEFYTVQGRQVKPGAARDQDQEMQDVWTVYDPSQFEVYTQEVNKTSNKKEDVLLRRGVYAEGRSYSIGAQPHPPVLRPMMSWPTAIGHEIAKAHRAIYRMESRADAGEMEAVASTMMQAAVGADEDFAGVFAKALKEGQTYVPYDKDLGEHKPFALPVGPAEQLRSTLERKEERLYKVLGQAVADNVQRSATEAVLNMSTGIAPLLTSLASKMQDVEEHVIELAAQEIDTRRMGTAPNDISVTYPQDFTQVAIGADEATSG